MGILLSEFERDGIAYNLVDYDGYTSLIYKDDGVYKSIIGNITQIDHKGFHMDDGVYIPSKPTNFAITYMKDHITGRDTRVLERQWEKLGKAQPNYAYNDYSSEIGFYMLYILNRYSAFRYICRLDSILKSDYDKFCLFAKHLDNKVSKLAREHI